MNLFWCSRGFPSFRGIVFRILLFVTTLAAVAAAAFQETSPLSTIDMHAHAFPDSLAPRAVETLSDMADHPEWAPVGDGTVDALLRSMDDANIDLCAVCAIATKPGQVKGIVKWQKMLLKRYSDRLIPFASIHPQDTQIDKWMGKIAAADIGCLKMHPFYQDFVVDDEAMFPFYQAAQARGMLLTFHAGMDIGFEGDATPDRASPKRIAAVADRFPELDILATHMGGWQMWDGVREHLAPRRIYVETSFAQPFMPQETFVDLVRAVGPEKICFGSDWPWKGQKQQLDALQKCGLSESELRQIQFKTAATLLNFGS